MKPLVVQGECEELGASFGHMVRHELDAAVEVLMNEGNYHLALLVSQLNAQGFHSDTKNISAEQLYYWFHAEPGILFCYSDYMTIFCINK